MVSSCRQDHHVPHSNRYFAIGAGKTGIDACLWLLERGFESSRLIRWIMPSDRWLLDRAKSECRIAPQWVRTFGTVFSAAFMAHVEAIFDDDAEKNPLVAALSPDRQSGCGALVGIDRNAGLKQERVRQLNPSAGKPRIYRAAHPPHTGNTWPTKQLAASLQR